MSWFPNKNELKQIEDLAYDGFFSPEEVMLSLDKTMQDLDDALAQDEEQIIAKSYLKGHMRARAHLQRKLLDMVDDDERSKEKLDTIKYLLATRYAHSDMSAITKMQKEMKEKELELQKMKIEHDEREKRLNRARQKEADRFKRSAFVLSLAQKAQMSEEETRIMAEAAGIGDVV